MKNIYQTLCEFVIDEQGATAVEYGMMVGLIAVAIIVAVAALGTELETFFVKIKDCLTDISTCT